MKVKKAVIPVAGLGTRMLPATKVVPKEMLPLIDKPGIQYIVEEAVASGIEDILMITSRGKWTIEDHFDYAPEIEEKLKAAGKEDELAMIRSLANIANITFVRQKELKGLGHAIWCARRFTGDEPFAVLLGDDVMCAEIPVLKQLIDASDKFGASAVGVQYVGNEDIGKYCSLDVENIENNLYLVKSLIEKPEPEQVMSNFAILGRYVLTSGIYDVLGNLPPGYGGEIQLTDGLNKLCAREKMLAVEFSGKRYDTGNIKGYLEATIQFGLMHPEAGEWLRDYLKSLKL
ncbi:MAG: UTP--glucose-1-phosphate uridylyltransferase GalU [Clostridiales bacterium]|jgi:UTP--glucose-1-phosphate uridylyltransferase|nr:UTP--glucose-1-phosphate uridylyltransferase GalU [Clostridiales bacterium]